MTSKLLLVGFLVLTVGLSAREPLKIGSGNPGLKVATKGPNAVVIYQDEPDTVGVGLRGGYMSRMIEVIIDQGYGFQRATMDNPEQLFPFDADSAFTSDGGKWNASFKEWKYEPRGYSFYRMNGGKLEILQDLQKEARATYRLASNEIFLGFIGNKVFYWRSFDPSRVLWKEKDSDTEFALKMPKGVVDVFGATKGLTKEVGFVVFGKSPGFFHYSPYTYYFIEFSFSNGKRVNLR